MMVLENDTKPLVRVVRGAHVRILGADLDRVTRAVAKVRERWPHERKLTISAHSEHPDWIHVGFDTALLERGKIDALLVRLRALIEERLSR